MGTCYRATRESDRGCCVSDGHYRLAHHSRRVTASDKPIRQPTGRECEGSIYEIVKTSDARHRRHRELPLMYEIVGKPRNHEIHDIVVGKVSSRRAPE